MCGTGFFLIPFLEAGADIDGVDASPHMLARCQQKCAAKGLSPGLYHQSLEDMALPRQYSFIFIPDRSFSLIYDKPVAQACLHKLWEQLQPQGWLVLDVKPSAQPGEFGEPGQAAFGVEDWPDGSTIVATSMWSQREHGRVIRNVTKYERFADGKLVETELFDYNERLYDQPEFEDMVRAAGFREIQVTKAYDDTAPAGHDTFVVACRKA